MQVTFFKKLLFAAALFATSRAQAQTAQLRPMRVAVLAPLYLDDAYPGGSDAYAKGFPRFTLPGFDFVQGAQMAFDSLASERQTLIAQVFDSKSKTQNMAALLSSHALDTMDLLIGAVKDTEYLALAAFAKEKNIPFVSAIYPNDGGVTANPFLVIVNSTLRAHCEAIYSYLLQTHSADNIVVCRRKGGQEDKINGYFRAVNTTDNKSLLNLHTSFFEDDFSALKSKLDSNQLNVLVGASLNEDFANGLVDAAYNLRKKYRIEIIGMPNWDGFKDIRSSNYKSFPIVYTSPFHSNEADSISRTLRANYLASFRGNGSDMVFRGFETVYLFTALLSNHLFDFTSHLNDRGTKIFSDYNFQPVYLGKTHSLPDYFENKHLYFMKLINGAIVPVK